MTRFAFIVLLAALLWWPVPSGAQPPASAVPTPPAAPVPTAPPPAPQSLEGLEQNGGARFTRMQLGRLLRQLPPAVGEVLQRDPSLLERPDYLAPYPALVAFLQQHPEIGRNPSFFLGEAFVRERTPADRAVDMVHDIQEGFTFLTVFSIVVGVLVWLVRTIIDQRRWSRLSKVQAEVHTKLLDRLTSNDDLLAYIQTPAGRRFLESAPLVLDGERRPAAPMSRIVWSLQGGVVLAALGLGLRFIQGRVVPEVAEGFFIVGTIVLALGAGFVVSAVLAYFVSARFGLIHAPQPTSHE